MRLRVAACLAVAALGAPAAAAAQPAEPPPQPAEPPPQSDSPPPPVYQQPGYQPGLLPPGPSQPGQPPPGEWPPQEPWVPPYEPPYERPLLKDWLPVLRLSSGAGIHLPKGRVLPSYDFDVAGGVRLMLRNHVWIHLEGGYSHVTEPTYGGNFGTLGPGVVLNRGIVSVGWMPKLVIGATWPGFAVGVRNTVVVPLVYHIGTVEIGHQYLHGELGDQHEVRFQVGFDPIMLLYTLALKAGLGASNDRPCPGAFVACPGGSSRIARGYGVWGSLAE